MSEYKKEEPRGAAQSGVISSGTDNGKLITKSCAIELNASQLQGLLRKLPATAKQARRFTSCVAEHPDAPTNHCNRAAGAVNLSDLALKYNPYLRMGGFKLKCRRPGQPIINKFGEPSGQVYWGLYRLDGVAA